MMFTLTILLNPVGSRFALQGTRKKVMTSAPAIKFPQERRKLLFQTRPEWSDGMLATQAKELAENLSAEPGEDSDKFLRAVVDACASNVAVLDESGNMLYASKAWH